MNMNYSKFLVNLANYASWSLLARLIMITVAFRHSRQGLEQELCINGSLAYEVLS